MHLNPKWTTKISFRYHEEVKLDVEVWNKEILKDDLVGSGCIDLVKWTNNGMRKFHEWIPLYHKCKSAGSMLIEMEFHHDGEQIGPEPVYLNGVVPAESFSKENPENSYLAGILTRTKTVPPIPITTTSQQLSFSRVHKIANVKRIDYKRDLSYAEIETFRRRDSRSPNRSTNDSRIVMYHTQIQPEEFIHPTPRLGGEDISPINPILNHYQVDTTNPYTEQMESRVGKSDIVVPGQMEATSNIFSPFSVPKKEKAAPVKQKKPVKVKQVSKPSKPSQFKINNLNEKSMDEYEHNYGPRMHEIFVHDSPKEREFAKYFLI